MRRRERRSATGDSRPGSPPSCATPIGELIEDVRVHGDDALCRALARFDGVDVDPDGLAVSDAEFAASLGPPCPPRC